MTAAGATTSAPVAADALTREGAFRTRWAGPEAGRRCGVFASLAPARTYRPATFRSTASQIPAARSGPPSRLMARSPVGEVTLISVR